MEGRWRVGRGGVESIGRVGRVEGRGRVGRGGGQMASWEGWGGEYRASWEDGG